MTGDLREIYYEAQEEHPPRSFHHPGFNGEPGIWEDWKWQMFYMKHEERLYLFVRNLLVLIHVAYVVAIHNARVQLLLRQIEYVVQFSLTL